MMGREQKRTVWGRSEMVQIEDANSSFISQLKTAYLTLGLKT